MIYNYNNRNEIDKLYIHDSVFEGFQYDYKMLNIQFSTINFWIKKKSTFCFNNVIFCNIQGCKFWGGRNNTFLDIYVDNDDNNINELIKMQNENPNFVGSMLNQGINFIPIKFEIGSGDTLLIIAESLEFEEEELQ